MTIEWYYGGFMDILLYLKPKKTSNYTKNQSRDNLDNIAPLATKRIFIIERTLGKKIFLKKIPALPNSIFLYFLRFEQPYNIIGCGWQKFVRVLCAYAGGLARNFCSWAFPIFKNKLSGEIFQSQNDEGTLSCEIFGLKNHKSNYPARFYDYHARKLTIQRLEAC